VGSDWFSPAGSFVKGSLAAQAQQGTLDEFPVSQQIYYAEFPTLAAAKSFIDATNCDNQLPTGPYDPAQQVKACTKAGTPFYVTPFGNNAGAITDLQHTIGKYLRFVVLGVVIIAVLVMMGTFGKVIADSRRETAVFRSLGASRLAISQIYITYTIIVALFVAGIALAAGTAGAVVLDHKLGPNLSVGAVVAYNASDVHKHFSLISINPLYLSIIVGLVLLSALLSAIFPLLSNMRRNPIRDMREE
jgi:ABC-type lipoprotein release transport system permease subunit